RTIRNRGKVQIHRPSAKAATAPASGRPMNDSVSSASPARAAAAPALSPNLALASGVGLCLLIALIAEYLAQFIPLIGAPIIAIAIGLVLTNLAGQAAVAKPCASRK